MQNPRTIACNRFFARGLGTCLAKVVRKWLTKVPLPTPEWDLLGRYLDALEWLTTKLEDLERVLIRTPLDDDRTRKLMSVEGISSVIATAVITSIGDISRFQSPEKRVSYFGFTARAPVCRTQSHPWAHL